MDVGKKVRAKVKIMYVGTVSCSYEVTALL